jgi:hypothetical protein
VPVKHFFFLTGVHLGLKKMYVAINQLYFWKGLYVDVANFVKQCRQCSETTELQTSDSDQPQLSEQAKYAEDSGKNRNTGIGNASKVWQKVRNILLGCYVPFYGTDFVTGTGKSV